MSNATPVLQLATGSVYHPPDEAYPRLLIMRRWPRGIAKGAVDQWERELGPSTELLKEYQSEAIDWDEFASRYRAQVEARPELLDWVVRMASTTGVVLLCSSHDPCHRDILAEVVRERAGAPSPARRG
ncbi:MAG: DUF488 family protein [Dehalococcoidia bacterium]|nr:DUF488 family protein [Dehalococcoidia bacterium]